MPSNLRRAAEDLDRLQLRDGAALHPGRALGRLEFAGTIEGAVRHADLIIDCVPDELESKLEIFSLLDRMAPPRAILGTPTVTLSIADLASCTYRASQCVAFELKALFLGEVELPPAIQIVKTVNTRPDVVDSVRGFWAELGHSTTVRTDNWQETSIPSAPKS